VCHCVCTVIIDKMEKVYRSLALTLFHEPVGGILLPNTQFLISIDNLANAMYRFEFVQIDTRELYLVKKWHYSGGQVSHRRLVHISTLYMPQLSANGVFKTSHLATCQFFKGKSVTCPKQLGNVIISHVF
jgi:hypothetical protein